MKLITTLFFTFLSALLFAQVTEAEDNKKVSNQNGEIFEGYYSNYFSFHGADSLGKIFFAIDNNRQQTKKKYKANNFLYFNIDGEWKKLKGHKKFKSKESNIEKVPSSEHFKFNYKENKLSNILSPSNGIQIDFLQPLKQVGDYGHKGMLFEIYTTKATLKYKDRIVEGNIISERLIDSVGLKTFSNVVKVIFRGFEFDGYYLNVEGLGDLYIHLVDTKAKVNLFKKIIYNLNDEFEPKDFDLEKTNYKVTKWKRLGLKKLPLAIEIDLPNSKLKLHTTHFKKYRNLLFFAFGMGTVEGELIYKGKTYPVYGLSELFKF